MVDESLGGDLHYLARIAERIPAMVAYWGADQQCKYANRAYSVWLGIEPSALVGRSIRDLLGDKLFKLNERHIDGALSGQVQMFERVVPGPDGVNRQSLAHYIPDIVDGRVLGFVAHVAEVTTLKDKQTVLQAVIESLQAEVEQLGRAFEDFAPTQNAMEDKESRIAVERKQFESALQDVTKLVDTLKESVVDHIAILDQQGGVTATNSAWREFAELWGTDARGSVPRSEVGSNYVVECRDVVGRFSSDAVEAAEGIAAVLSGRQDLYTLEYKCHSPQDERWFHMSATLLQTSASGAVIVHADITPGRRHRVRAHESRGGALRVDH
jgi:PAS domain S-box-containing protein